MASITSLYPSTSHSVTMRTTSLSSDEDMLDITTHGTTQVTTQKYCSKTSNDKIG